ncbi:MAG: MATE family efflux transporter [Ruminococcaceae bacterium]|nr:MATE family efflux transporter [Oscillospiraceae bacterium]
MFKIKEINSTEGPLVPSIIKYAIPIAIGALVQVLFNSADIMVLGNFANSVAVAAVGATTPIVGLVVNSFVGLAGGTNVILAHSVGAKDNDRIKRTVGTSLILSVAIGMILAVVGLFFADWFLEVSACPDECIEGASLYLKIYFASAPFLMLYNFGAAILRVTGDTQRPLYYLIACGLLNVVLNFILCVILSQKVAAVAIATFASQVLGALLVMIRLIKMDGPCKTDLRHLIFCPKTFGRIMALGLPGALNASLYNIANIQIQSAINSYGTAAMAGNTAAISIESWVASFTNSVAATAMAFVGQNLGAKKPERVKKTILYCMVIGVALGILLGDGFFLFGKQFLGVYLPGETEAIEYGYVRMHYILALYFIAAISGVLGNAIAAFGYSILSMFNSVFSVLILRFVWMFFVYPHFQTIHNLYLCFTVSWILALIVNIIMFSVIYRNFKKGKIMKI